MTALRMSCWGPKRGGSSLKWVARRQTRGAFEAMAFGEGLKEQISQRPPQPLPGAQNRKGINMTSFRPFQDSFRTFHMLSARF